MSCWNNFNFVGVGKLRFPYDPFLVGKLRFPYDPFLVGKLRFPYDPFLFLLRGFCKVFGGIYYLYFNDSTF